MTRKPHATALIPAMPAEQRELLEGWLFTENISYSAAVKRCAEQFGVKLNRTSVAMHYQKLAQERALMRIAQCADRANAVVKTLTDHPAKTFTAITQVIGQMIFEYQMDPTKKPEVNKLGKMIELLIAARKEEREENRFAFEREKWEIDVARLCFEHHGELQKITADDSLDEGERLYAIRRRLFGEVLPE